MMMTHESFVASSKICFYRNDCFIRLGTMVGILIDEIGHRS
jgi:hypothetical protein